MEDSKKNIKKFLEEQDSDKIARAAKGAGAQGGEKTETTEKSEKPIDTDKEKKREELEKLKDEEKKAQEEKKRLEEKRAQDAQKLTETNIGIMTAKKKAEEKEKEKGPVRETLEEKVEQKTKKPTGKKVKTSKAGSPDQPKADLGKKGEIPQTPTSALGQYQAEQLSALGYSEWQIKRMSFYKIKQILNRQQKPSEKKPVAPVPEKVGNEKGGKESKKETLKSDWTTEDEKTLNNLLVVVENENKTIENAKKRMTEIDAEIEKAKIQPEKIPEVKSEATLVEYSIDGKAITREEKEKEIDNRIVISGTSGGFTVFDATNIKNKGAGTSNDVRPMNYTVEGENYFKNSPEANKKWNGSDKPFTFIYTRNRRDYLIATAGLNAYTGKSDGGRNGNIFISIEITKDLPQWIEEYLLKKAINIANEEFDKLYNLHLEFKKDYLSNSKTLEALKNKPEEQKEEGKEEEVEGDKFQTNPIQNSQEKSGIPIATEVFNEKRSIKDISGKEITVGDIVTSQSNQDWLVRGFIEEKIAERYLKPGQKDFVLYAELAEYDNGEVNFNLQNNVRDGECTLKEKWQPKYGNGEIIKIGDIVKANVEKFNFEIYNKKLKVIGFNLNGFVSVEVLGGDSGRAVHPSLLERAEEQTGPENKEKTVN